MSCLPVFRFVHSPSLISDGSSGCAVMPEAAPAPICDVVDDIVRGFRIGLGSCWPERHPAGA
jgi:hypothetical protein